MFQHIPKQTHPHQTQPQPHYFDRTQNPQNEFQRNPRNELPRNPPVDKWTAPAIHPVGSAMKQVNPEAVNISNLENAKRLQAEIRAESTNSGLGLLAAYSDSDGE